MTLLIVLSFGLWIVRCMAPRPQLSLRGIPTRECICGSDLFTIQATFDEGYEIAGYLMNAECAYCHAKLTAPTPLDLVEA
jgi:hypothetical protein